MSNDQDQSAGAVRGRPERRRYLPLAIGAVALLGGYLIGSQGAAESRAYAEKVAEILKEKELIPIAVSPPAIAVATDGWAIVGGADDRYYIVRSDGTTREVFANRRRNLLWRYQE